MVVDRGFCVYNEKIEKLGKAIRLPVRKVVFIMLNGRIKQTLIIGVTTFLFIPIVAFGQSSASSISSSRLSSNQSSSALTTTHGNSQTEQLDWLNRRLSQTRSPMIQSRLGVEGTSVTTDPNASPTYMERRAALKRHAESQFPAEAEEGVESISPTGYRLLGPEVDRIKNQSQNPEPVSSPGMVSAPSNGGWGDVQTPGTRWTSRSWNRNSPEIRPQSEGKDALTSNSEKTLETTEPMSGNLGYKPFEKVDENGEIIDDRLIPFLETEETGEKALVPGEEEEKDVVEEALEQAIPPSMVRPYLPEPPKTDYQRATENRWSQVPVRQPRTSQFGPGVDPSTIPFERSSVRFPGMYSGYEGTRTGDGTNLNPGYQYRGPRLYSIGETEYDDGSTYQTLPYYRR